MLSLDATATHTPVHLDLSIEVDIDTLTDDQLAERVALDISLREPSSSTIHDRIPRA